MEVDELAPGLWRWTAEDECSSVYYERGRDVCLFDPLLPLDDRDRFWAALDRDVERVGGRVYALLTVSSEPRSSAEIVARYGARLWREGDALPAGVEKFDSGRPGDLAFWIPEHRALVAGDSERGETLRLLLGLDVELSLNTR